MVAYLTRGRLWADYSCYLGMSLLGTDSMDRRRMTDTQEHKTLSYQRHQYIVVREWLRVPASFLLSIYIHKDKDLMHT